MINTGFDSLSSLTVGNGRFAFTVDVTGFQSFPENYSNGVPLGTQSEWGWHSFSNTANYSFDETLLSSGIPKNGNWKVKWEGLKRMP